MQLESYAQTDVGRRRRNNEDHLFADPRRGVFAVADGMGGHAAGEVASEMAVAAVAAAAADPDSLVQAVRAANTAILTRGTQERDKDGMGTTLTALALSVHERRFRIAHVGDSRAYLLRGGALEQLTVDHTWVQQRVDCGDLTPEQARTHPLSSVLTRSLGIDDAVEVDVVTGELRENDLFLLCSDGLTGMLADDELRAQLREERPLAETAGALVRAANDAGGTDNITVVLVRAAA